MAGFKRCALKGEKGKGNRREKKRKKEEKWGSKSFLFFVFCISPCACFSSFAQWSFFKYIRKTVSRLDRSYPLLFAIKILMVSQFGDL